MNKKLEQIIDSPAWSILQTIHHKEWINGDEDFLEKLSLIIRNSIDGVYSRKEDVIYVIDQEIDYHESDKATKPENNVSGVPSEEYRKGFVQALKQIKWLVGRMEDSE